MTEGDAQGAALLSKEKGLDILLVEDEALILMAATEMLEEMGHRVRPAGTAAAARAVLDDTDAVSVMFTDVNLPDLDGTDLAREARSRRPSLPVLFATGYRMDVPLDLAASGPTLILDKPYWSDDVERALREVCRIAP